MSDHQIPPLHEQLRREAEYLSDCRHHLGNVDFMEARLKAVSVFLIEVAVVLEAYEKPPSLATPPGDA